MATIADIMDRAARRCSVGKILNMVSATTETALELKDVLAETAEELLDRLDLPDPITREFVINSQGVASYSLPGDFLRLTRDRQAVSDQSRRYCQPVTDDGTWRNINLSGGGRYYRLIGSNASGLVIQFHPPLASGEKVTLSYISKGWVFELVTPSAMIPSGGGGPVVGGKILRKDTWTKEEEESLLPATLLQLGVVFRFRARKGLPHADVLAEYETRLSRIINDSRGIKLIDMSDKCEEGCFSRVSIPDYSGA